MEHFYFKTEVVYDAMRRLTQQQQQADAAAAAAAEAAAAETAADEAAEDGGEGGDEPVEVVVVRVPLDFMMPPKASIAMQTLIELIFKVSQGPAARGGGGA